MVKDTPGNEYHDMDSDETSNGDIFKISRYVCSVERYSNTTISLYYVRDNDVIQEKH